MHGDLLVERFTPKRADFGKDPGALHFAGVRLSSKQFDHPRFFVRLTTSSPVLDPIYLEKRNRTVGAAMSVGMWIHGSIVEHTEGYPGLLLGEVWEFVVLSKGPVEIVKVDYSDTSPFAQFLEREQQEKRPR